MKVYFLALISLAISSPALVADSLGQSCSSNPAFQVTGFSVSPWPLYLNQNYTFTMTGYFTSNELLDQLSVGTKKGIDAWKYTFFNVNQNYLKNANATFTYQMWGPPEKGSFIEQVTLHRPNYSIFSCWQFTYTIA